MNRNDFRLASDWVRLRAVAVAGTLILASTQPSFARHDNLNFRDFRNQNSEVSRHVARQAFRTERRELRVQDAERLRPNPILHGAGSVESAATTMVQRIRHANAGEPGNGAFKNRSVQLSAEGQLLHLKSGIDLDLSSAHRNISLGKNLFADGGSVEINSGGETKTVGAGSLVSAAEYVAVKQVLGGDGQKVTIDRGGRAVGGTVDLEAIASDRTTLRASELVIPENVTTSGDFSRNSDFRLLGDLNNYGTVLATSGDGSKRSGAIRAVDINNYRGATIHSDIDLTLDASGNLNNAGTIESTGGLVLSAAGVVLNKGTVKGAGDVSLQSAGIANRGTIESLVGDVNLDGSSLAVMNVNNSKGTLQALNGAINIRDTSYDAAFDSNVVGGDLLSREVNLYAGQNSTANVRVEQLTGVVNEYGLAGHVIASTDTLKIGTVCLTGDPTIYNLTGDIDIAGDVSSINERLVLVATGNITSADGIKISTSNPLGGRGIELIAGAAFKLQGGGVGAGFSATTVIPPLNPVSAVELSGKSSKTGGGVLLGDGVIITTRGDDSAPNQNGDVVALIAFAGKGPGAGTVDVSGTTILTGGKGTGFNGDVFILAAATKGDAVKTGIIDTTGGSVSDGPNHSGVVGIFTVDIVTSQKGQPVVYDEFGIRGPVFLTGEELSKKGNLIVTDTAAPIDIKASGFVSLNGGGLVSLQGQVEAATGADNAGSAQLISNVNITNGPLGSVKSSSVIFLISPNIGTATDPISVDAPDVESFGGNGSLNFVKITGTGDCQIGGTSKGTLSFDAPGRNLRDLDFGAVLSTNALVIIADTIDSPGFLSSLINANSVSVTTITGSIDGGNFIGPINTNKLVLNAGGNIGTAGTAVTFNGTSGSATAGGFINAKTVDKFTFTTLNATTGGIKVTAGNSLTLPLLVNSGGGVVDITDNAGTLTITGDINAKDGISLLNTNGSGKIVFNKDATLTTNSTTAGLGDISVSVLPVGAATGTPANVVIDKTGTGNVVFTGSGVSAKTPVNTLHIPTAADITINNGLKVSNITFGGGVEMTADGP